MMTTYITLGRLSIPADTVAAFASLFLSALLFTYMVKLRIGDWYWNSFMLYIAVYKLSYIFIHFHSFLDNPMSLLYFNGGVWGQILAFVSIALYLLIIQQKQLVTLESFSVFLLFFTIYQLVLHSLKQNFFACLLEFLCLIWVLFWAYQKRITIKWFLFFLLLEALLLSFFNELQIIRNLSCEFWGLFVLAVIKRRNRVT